MSICLNAFLKNVFADVYITYSDVFKNFRSQQLAKCNSVDINQNILYKNEFHKEN